MARYVERSGRLGALFTGYHGDKGWDKNLPEKYINDQLIRGDMSGINISEARLQSGFFNVAIPFIYARSTASIYAMSCSVEMSRWSMGGSYERPIPSRISEDRGVTRNSFGIRKKAIIDRYPEPKSLVLVRDFRRLMRKKFKFTVFSFYIMKWRYVYVTTIGKKLTTKGIKSRSRFDFSYCLWFGAANRYIDDIKSRIR